MDEILEAIRAVNNYWFMIMGLIGHIAVLVEMRIKLAHMARDGSETKSKVIEHDRWIERAKGRWGNP